MNDPARGILRTRAGRHPPRAPLPAPAPGAICAARVAPPAGPGLSWARASVVRYRWPSVVPFRPRYPWTGAAGGFIMPRRARPAVLLANPGDASQARLPMPAAHSLHRATARVLRLIVHRDPVR